MILAVLYHQTCAFYINPVADEGPMENQHKTDNAAEEKLDTRFYSGSQMYSPAQYGGQMYGQSQYGNAMYGQAQYGITIYGPTQNENAMYSPPQYGSQMYGLSQYGNAMYGQPQYASQMYGQPASSNPATVQAINGTCNRVDCLKLYDNHS